MEWEESKVKLQLSNVVKSFSTHDILKGANLQVRGNEKIALVGENGELLF